MTRRGLVSGFIAGLCGLFTSCSSAQYPQFPRDDKGEPTGNQYYSDRWEVAMRRELAKHLPVNIYGAGFSVCECCHMPWWVVRSTFVAYERGSGSAAVCSSCWRNLNPDELWPFYQAWIRRTYPGAIVIEATLRENVLSGKVDKFGWEP